MKVLVRVVLTIVVLAIALAVAFFVRPFEIARQAQRVKLWWQGAREHSLTLDGYRIHYFEMKPRIGDGDKIVVLVHGLGGSAQDWTPLMAPLARQGYRVYAPDLLGFGQSDKPDVAYSVPLEAQIVEQFIAQLRLQHVTLAGWSAGGWVAQTVALDQPGEIDILLLYNSAGIQLPLDWAPRLYGADTLEGAAEFSARVSPNSKRPPAFVLRDFLRVLREQRSINLRMLSSMLSGRDLLDARLHQITIPTALIWGAIDTMTPITAAEKMQEMIPGSTLVRIEGCGHLAPAECTPAVLDATLSFLREPIAQRGKAIRYPQNAAEPVVLH